MDFLLRQVTGPLINNSQPQTTDVLLVIMVLAVPVNGKWRLPLAYYLTVGTTLDLHQSVLTDLIRKIWECGSGAQPEFLRGGGPNLGPSTKRGSGVSSPESFLKTYIGDLVHYITSVAKKIIILANLKVMFFSALLEQIFPTVKKYTGNLNYYYYKLMNNLPIFLNVT